jgi:hypothetical protein
MRKVWETDGFCNVFDAESTVVERKTIQVFDRKTVQEVLKIEVLLRAS